MSDDDHELMCAEVARLVMGWTAVDIPWAYDGGDVGLAHRGGRSCHDRVLVAA